MEQPALFAGLAPVDPGKSETKRRRPDGRFQVHPGAIPLEAEIATTARVEGVGAMFNQIFPNPSEIIRERSNGRGVRIYDQMLKTDADISGLINDLVDDVLHFPTTTSPFSNAPEHLEHAKFCEMALRRVSGWQSILRHALEAPARGFAVFEKIYEVVDRGEWRGAVVYGALLDKPQSIFSFDSDRRLRLKTILNQYPGELVNQDKFLRLTWGSNSNPWGDPGLDYCYFPWKLKHHALENQAIYMEKWASPTALAEYDWSGNPKINQVNVGKALAALQSIQTDQSLAIPKGIAVKLLESMRSGIVSYTGYIAQLTEMMSRFLTGQILTSMGGDGGSHALGKVHEKRAANKTEMYAIFAAEDFITNNLYRELVVRNYGPQEGYPSYKILAKDPVARQAEATLEQQLISLGHSVSAAHSSKVFGVVAPRDASDVLTPSLVAKPGQTLPVAFAALVPDRLLASHPAHRELHTAAKGAAKASLDQLTAIGREATAKAKPAIKAAVKGLAGGLRKKKKASEVKKAHVYQGLPKLDVGKLGHVYHRMFKPGDGHVELAETAADGGTPPDISTAAKLALALQVMAIANRIADAAGDAPEETTGAEAADSMTDPNGVAVDEAFSNMFEGTHSTNIASIATAQLRDKLADPAYRKDFPYVMIVTHSDARASHLAMDGFILASEEARYSPFLAPYGFGCRCIPVPISAEQAKAAGLTGAAPAGTLDDFLQGKGFSPARSGGYRTPDGKTIQPGAPDGFQPAYADTDFYVQLEAVRAKAEELRAEDPDAWAALAKWLRWLFDGVDPLTTDPGA